MLGLALAAGAIVFLAVVVIHDLANTGFDRTESKRARTVICTAGFSDHCAADLPRYRIDALRVMAAQTGAHGHPDLRRRRY